MQFDGDTESPNHPENNCSNLPAMNSPEWKANQLAETIARAVAGSGVNRARAATLAADRAAAEKTREQK